MPFNARVAGLADAMDRSTAMQALSRRPDDRAGGSSAAGHASRPSLGEKKTSWSRAAEWGSQSDPRQALIAAFDGRVGRRDGTGLANDLIVGRRSMR